MLGPVSPDPLNVALAPEPNQRAAPHFLERRRGDPSRRDETLERERMHPCFFRSLARGVGCHRNLTYSSPEIWCQGKSLDRHNFSLASGSLLL
jgi:hypothetical protein